MIRAFLLLPLLTLAACDSESPFDPEIDIVDVSSGDVREAMSRWEASGGEDYTMTLRRSCFCAQEALGPFEIRVEGGAIVSVRNDGRTVSLDLGRSITDLLSLLESALDEDAASVQAAFDAEKGYPLRLAIDYDEFIADEEVSYTVTRVTLD